ncbi:protoporphyrinogen oxidase [bacterium]|nr:protoporphyrinogen oxidase [bacterium]
MSKPDAHKTQTLIVGGGLSGLSYAYYLKKKKPKHEITLLEKNSRLGGLIYTDTVDTPLGPCTLEYGPDSFLPKTSHILDLIDDLGLNDQLINIDPNYQRSYILHKGQLQATPLGFYLIAPKNITAFLKSPLLSWSGKLRVLAEVFISKGKDKDPSLEDFVVRRFGKELFEVIAQGMVSGIYTSDPKKLSLKATLPVFIELEQKYGSVILGLLKNSFTSKSSGPRYNLFYSLQNGMSQLIHALEKSLLEQGVHIQKNCLIKTVDKDEHGYIVTDQNNTQYATNTLVMANTLQSSSQLLAHCSPKLSDALQSIRTASSAIAILIYKKSDIENLPKAAGFIIPEIEQRKILACSFLNHKFPQRSPQDTVVCRVFMGGMNNESILNHSDQELMQLAHDELSDILGIKQAALFQTLQRWPRAMPQYEIGHAEKNTSIDKLNKSHPNIVLLGNHRNGVGLSDVIKQHFV